MSPQADHVARPLTLDGPDIQGVTIQSDAYRCKIVETSVPVVTAACYTSVPF